MESHVLPDKGCHEEITARQQRQQQQVLNTPRQWKQQQAICRECERSRDAACL
jgi:hypothetical protein